MRPYVAGRYDFRLSRTEEGRRISGLTFPIQWATGNQHIVQLSAAKRWLDPDRPASSPAAPAPLS